MQSRLNSHALPVNVLTKKCCLPSPMLAFPPSSLAHHHVISVRQSQFASQSAHWGAESMQPGTLRVSIF